MMSAATKPRELVDRLGDESRALHQRCLADIRRSEAVRCEEAAAKHKDDVAGSQAENTADQNTADQNAVR